MRRVSVAMGVLAMLALIRAVEFDRRPPWRNAVLRRPDASRLMYRPEESN